MTYIHILEEQLRDHCGNLRAGEWLYDAPAHISGEQGLSLLCGSGYAALITRQFFEEVGSETVLFSVPILKALASEAALRILYAVISMGDISCCMGYGDYSIV